ncbi:MAG: SIMPL domain-containing protein [Eubacteriales bacterium]|nr:SIMPL domain-containing protein [Eubacteriales bacterium]
MTKTITVRGTGRASVSPDQVELTMYLEAKNMDYENAMDTAAQNISLLTNALTEAGFEEKDLKTSSFNVYTEYDSERQEDESYRNVFKGYVVSHNLNLRFDFTSERLTSALSAVGTCKARPQLNVSFTVKDTEAVNEETLRNAAANARKKAEVLCAASGKKLGELVNIDYGTERQGMYSNTRYAMADEVMAEGASMMKSVSIMPEDISVSDSAVFTWEIV